MIRKNGWVYGIKILNPKQLHDINAAANYILSTSALETIERQLLDMGIDPSKINKSFVETKVNARKNL